MRVLLLSTYELGHQPYHIASPAARLQGAGHQVLALDLAVEEYDPDRISWAQAVAISVPMHTAMRLGIDTANRIKTDHSDLPLVFYGLYAAVGADRTVGNMADAVFVGEYEPGLIDWLERLEQGKSPLESINHHISPMNFQVPDRSMLPPMEQYARLMVEGEALLAGYTEASHGCRHRCRHCPLPVVYDGRFRTVGLEAVLGDIEQQVAAGARHITFGDPDFLNGPVYALEVLSEAHRSFPQITFDLTTKVEHILKLSYRWDELSKQNLLFVTSAFESTDDQSLAWLDKGHTCTDLVEAVQLLRTARIEIRPTWLPFLPWTQPHHLTDMFDFLSEHDLFSATDPVQIGLRLLIPEGSLIMNIDEARHLIGEYDPAALTYSWQAEHPVLDMLQRELMLLASVDADHGVPAEETLTEQWRLSLDILGGDTTKVKVDTSRPVPSLSESWFCCAEPTELQQQRVTVGV